MYNSGIEWNWLKTITISSAIPYPNQINDSYIPMPNFLTTHNECLSETCIQESEENIQFY